MSLILTICTTLNWTTKITFFDGKTTLKDFYNTTNTDSGLFESEKGESETIAGFLLEVSGRFMKKDEKMQFKKIIFSQ